MHPTFLLNPQSKAFSFETKTVKKWKGVMICGILPVAIFVPLSSEVLHFVRKPTVGHCWHMIFQIQHDKRPNCPQTGFAQTKPIVTSLQGWKTHDFEISPFKIISQKNKICPLNPQLPAAINISAQFKADGS